MTNREHTGGSTIVSIRLPDTLLARLDRYLDWSENRTGLKSSRNQATRQALAAWLDEREQAAGLKQPESL